MGMAKFGDCLLAGAGGPQDDVFGVMNVTEAAHLGSDVGAFLLGRAFFESCNGLPKDPVRAQYWLKKAFDGECEVKHLNEEGRAEAAVYLRELQDE